MQIKESEYLNIKSRIQSYNLILVTGSEKLASEAIDTKTTHKAHGITRGADYYRR